MRSAGCFAGACGALIATGGDPMKLVIGLGNPGRQYEGTRHNAGFWWVDRLARQAGVTLRTEPRFHGQLAKLAASGHECWLLKPDTFMNESGRAARALAQFYKLPPAQILVVHDELDLAPGVVKLKQGGGVAGHNGLKDIAAHLGHDFWRLRIGIGHPGDRAQVVNYVLASPRQEEAELIGAAIDRSLEVWPLLVRGETEAAMHRMHTRS
jgi:peptidyl-tRNA hydrolase, PTH1 family